MFKLDSEKAEESKIKLPKSVRSSKKQASTSALLTTKAFDCVDHNKLENSERDGNTRPPDLTLEKSVCRSRKTELDMKQQTGSKQEKEYIKAVYCHPAYLTYMQSIS